MAENLKVTHYHNGDTIPTGLSEIEWIRAGVKISDQQKTDTWKANIGAYAVYDDNESNADTYGYLYNWHAVNDSRGLAPEGWHVPTNDEWITLTNYLGNVASRKLAGNADLWDNGMLKSYYDSTNKIRSEFGTSGFKALPGGIRHKQGGYFSMGNQCSFWSSTSRGDSQAWFRKLIYHNEGKFQDSYPYQAGFSVRCIRD
jgi:uncharacterized protein (TIGR02145 family)